MTALHSPLFTLESGQSGLDIYTSGRDAATVPEILLNKTPVLDGAGTVYQRKEGGPWYLYFWVKSERKRFRQSLEPTDRRLAIRTAEQAVPDALARCVVSPGHLVAPSTPSY